MKLNEWRQSTVEWGRRPVLNMRQRWIAVVAVSIIAFLHLFPNWIEVAYLRSGPIEIFYHEHGRGFVFDKPRNIRWNGSRVEVDVQSLYMQSMTVLLVSLVLLMLVSDRVWPKVVCVARWIKGIFSRQKYA